MTVSGRNYMATGSLIITPTVQGLVWSLWTSLFQTFLLHSHLTSGQSVVLFQRAPQCPGKVLSASLTYGQFVVRGKVQCAAFCLQDFSCLSFLFHPYNRVCHLGSEPSHTNCSNMVPSADLQHYDMNLTDGSTSVNDLYRPHPVTMEVSYRWGGSCICPPAYKGASCAMVMKDCDDLYHNGNIKEDGVYWIYPSSSTYSFPVYCRMVNRPRTYVMNRVYNNVTFQRGWQDYKDGFGNLYADYWLGLEKLHLLTASEDYELRFRIRLRSSNNLFQFYRDVRVGNEEENYRLELGTDAPKGSLGDSLSAVNGANFSTPDRDNDGSTVNCASLHQAGFWFRGDNCTLCNPTGPLLQPENEKRQGIPNEVFWENDLGNTVPYKLSVYLVNTLKRRKRSL